MLSLEINQIYEQINLIIILRLLIFDITVTKQKSIKYIFIWGNQNELLIVLTVINIKVICNR